MIVFMIYLFLIVNDRLVLFLKLVINHILFSIRFQLRIPLYIHHGNCLLQFIVAVEKIIYVNNSFV